MALVCGANTGTSTKPFQGDGEGTLLEHAKVEARDKAINGALAELQRFFAQRCPDGCKTKLIQSSSIAVTDTGYTLPDTLGFWRATAEATWEGAVLCYPSSIGAGDDAIDQSGENPAPLHCGLNIFQGQIVGTATSRQSREDAIAAASFRSAMRATGRLAAIAASSDCPEECKPKEELERRVGPTTVLAVGYEGAGTGMVLDLPGSTLQSNALWYAITLTPFYLVIRCPERIGSAYRPLGDSVVASLGLHQVHSGGTAAALESATADKSSFQGERSTQILGDVTRSIATSWTSRIQPTTPQKVAIRRAYPTVPTASAPVHPRPLVTTVPPDPIVTVSRLTSPQSPHLESSGVAAMPIGPASSLMQPRVGPAPVDALAPRLLSKNVRELTLQRMVSEGTRARSLL